MLAQILQDMWVEPEVLEALGEEQKRILFLKMREEQVRRWKEREEKEERERGHNRNTKSKKASSKHVRWLLGRDGDVSVSIIGEVDELRSSRLLQNLMNNRFQSDNMNAIQREDLLPGSEDQQLNLKEDIQLPVTRDDTASPNDQSSEEDMDSCSADDDPKDTAEDSDSESGSGSDNLGDWTPLYKPHFSSHGNQQLRAPLADTEKTGPQDGETACYKEKPEGRGRVEQLRKKFADNPHDTSTASKKPPIPAKPAHLQK